MTSLKPNARRREDQVPTASLLVALALVWLTVPVGVVEGQTLPLPAPEPGPADALFDVSVLHDLRLTMKPEDWATLKARVLWDTYYPADFQWRDTTMTMVAVRSRGAGSRYSYKPSLKIDFNRYVDQKFLKQKALILANAVQDPGMLNRRLAMLVYTRMGLPAPRVVHARLFVNGEYIGLYELVEDVEKPMLGRVFGRDAGGKKRDEGYLFEYRWDENYFWTYSGSDLGPYAALFEAKTREDDAPADLYGPIEEMIRVINQVGDAEFEAAAGAFIDFRQFVQFLAVEHFIGEIDGFIGRWGPNNFYIYRFEGGKQSAFIPWDKDTAFYELFDDLFDGMYRTVLGRRTMAVPALRRLYLDTLLACAARVSERDTPESPVPWIEAELLRERAQILAAARADPYKPYSNQRVDESHEETLGFVRNRGAYVAAQVQRELARQFLEPR